ncbi:MAG TPA: DUF268 domain-containing protein [Ignavibacteria bacterium]
MKKILWLLNFIGFDPKIFFYNITGLFWYFKDYRLLRKQLNSKSDFKVNLFPILRERTEQSGTVSGHYFHQDLLIAGKIFKNNPHKHIDIGSRIDGFVAHVASFREIEVFDIRALTSSIENVKFKQVDFTNLPEEYFSYTDSLSCLHAIEHFGLGRYNDSIDVNGHLKGLESMYKTLKTGGKFYFAAPLGDLRIEFNAHRVFSIEYLLRLFKDKYKIVSFSYVDDHGNLHKNIELNELAKQNNFGCKYGCGIFELHKL